ncbi:hypothetical protein COY07_06060 [Candidatus Peregrinibacteria bacterium CG_4_10_14_0_2_um_filter_43_11]|nr:MAG: hypothetical protein COY07_06060 [Candidatus Peregrinibacteria bacterium CG_4_10_14_0_2_um_filter_43_11]
MKAVKNTIVAFFLPIFFFTSLSPITLADERTAGTEAEQTTRQEAPARVLEAPPRFMEKMEPDNETTTPTERPTPPDETQRPATEETEVKTPSGSSRSRWERDDEEQANPESTGDDGQGEGAGTSTNAEPYSPDNSNKPDALDTQKKLQGNLHVGEFTGAAVYDYPLALPAGRNGLTPQISLTYNSQEQNFMNMVGYRWNITDFSIRRYNKKGVERMYDDNFFIANTPVGSGELGEVSLSDGHHGIYGQKVESGFEKYEFKSDNSWVVKDKNGTRYQFGLTQETRVFDPDDTSRTYEWKLEEVRDTNDNFIRYTYKKYGNDIYPERIFYGGHGSEEGPFEVFFTKEMGYNNTFFSYAPGFRLNGTYHITDVEVYVNGVLRKQYYFGYYPPDITQIWTITSITETAYDTGGNATVLPPTTFEYTKSAVGWKEEPVYPPSDWWLSICGEYGCVDTGTNVFLWDMTGDGLPDFEYIGQVPPSSAYKGMRATNNAKGGWNIANDQKYIGGSPNPSYSHSIPSLTQKLADFDGDGRLDIVGSSMTSKYGNSGPWEVISGAALAIGKVLSNIIPFGMTTSDYTKPDHGVVIGDLNGDGLPDMVQAEAYLKKQLGYKTCLNNGGTSCDSTDFWISPTTIVEYISEWVQQRTGYLTDCNLDGLADLQYSGSTSELYINDGKGGWLTDVSVGAGKDSCSFGTTSENNTTRSIDVNGDGLMDSVYAAHEYNSWGSFDLYKSKVGLRTPSSADIHYEGIFPVPMGKAIGDHKDYGVRIIDLNGDLLPDVIQSFHDWDNATKKTVTSKRVFMNTGSRPYFLKTVHTGQGAQIDLTYKTSAQYIKDDGTQANPKLPIIVTTVDKVIVNDGMGVTNSIDYFYEDGHYYFKDSYNRGFAGFRVVTKTDNTGVKTKTYFHQSENSIADVAQGEYSDHYSKKGLPYRTEIYNNVNQLIHYTVNRWETTDLGNERYFPHQVQTVSRLITPINGTIKATAQSFEYDAYGNAAGITDYGEVNATGEDGSFTDTGNDLLKIENNYTENLSNYLVGLPSESKRYNQSNQLVQHQRFYYDGLSLKNANKGNLSKKEVWLNTPTGWLSTEYAYNGYGLPVSEKNPRGYSTTYTYDTHHLYPTTVTNPKGQVSQFTYDIANGQVLSATDPNGVKSVNIYDGFGRLLSAKKSDPHAPGNMALVQEASYNDTAMPRITHQKRYHNAINFVESYGYSDGLGRAIEQKQEMPGGKWTTTATIYDERGNVKKTLQPYSSSSSVFETIDSGKLGNAFTYDTLNRVTSITNPLGVTANAYNGWKQTVTDPKGNVKEYFYDARNQLISVNEHNIGSVYTTQYNYDAIGNLIKITDAENNIRDFTFDSLGRRLTQTAPYKSGSTPQIWTYNYDANSNPIARTTPKKQTVKYSYDELDRAIKEDDPTTPEVELQYVYDQGAYGIGRLNHITAPAYQHYFEYDAWGRTLNDQKIIGEKTFNHAFDYDLMDGPTTMTYPNEMNVQYTYDDVHLLSAVKADGNVVADHFIYSPLGQITEMTFGDGVVVKNFYDVNQLYRLIQRESFLGSNALQHTEYTYDAVGNLMKLIDNSNATTAKTVQYTYDDLYRLTQAKYISVASGDSTPQSYTYSPTGNMLSKANVGTFTYASLHPHAVTQAGTHHFVYDVNGNMTERDGEVMQYDYRDRLIQSGDKVSFAYGEGYERLSKTNLKTGVIQYYPSIYYETDNAKEDGYIYAGDLKISKVEFLSTSKPVIEELDPVLEGPYYTFSGTKTSGTSVWMNGAEVIPANTSESWSYTVTLKPGENLFVLTSKSEKGTESDVVEVTLHYEVAPVTVTPFYSPVYTTEFTLSGTKGANTGVWINHEEVVPVNAQTNWSATVTLKNYNNAFAILSKDEAGNEGSILAQTVIYAVPVPSVDSVGSSPQKNPIVLTGKKATGTSLWMNDVQVVSLNNETNWSAEVSLGKGGNSFTFFTKNAFGLKSNPVAFSFDYSVLSPSIDAFPSLIYTFNYTLSGTKSPFTGIWINDKEMIPLNSDTKWAYTVNITGKENTFSIYSKDSAGIKSEKKTVSIVYKTPTPIVDDFSSSMITNPLKLTGTKVADTSIWINEKEYVALDNQATWTTKVILSTGMNDFNVISKTSFGAVSSSVDLHIPYNITAPVINPIPDVVYKTHYALTGAKPANTSIWINNKEVVPFGVKTNWSALVTLDKHKNTFTVFAKDKEGNESTSVSQTILYEVLPPWASPVALPVSNPVMLNGIKSSDLSLWMNGVEIYPSGSSNWKIQIPLEKGINTFTFLTKNEFGMESEPAVIAITYSVGGVILDTKSMVSSSTSYLFSGTKPSHTTLWINNEPISVDSEATEWSYLAPLTAVNTAFTFITRDDMNVAGDPVNVTIFYNAKPPVLNAYPKQVSKPLYVFSGSKGIGAGIWVNNVQVVPFNTESTWEYTVTLKKGENHFTFASGSNFGVKSPIVEATMDYIKPSTDIYKWMKNINNNVPLAFHLNPRTIPQNPHTSDHASSATEKRMDKALTPPEKINYPSQDGVFPEITKANVINGEYVLVYFSEKIVFPADKTSVFVITEKNTGEKLPVLAVVANSITKIASLKTAKQKAGMIYLLTVAPSAVGEDGDSIQGGDGYTIEFTGSGVDAP